MCSFLGDTFCSDCRFPSREMKDDFLESLLMSFKQKVRNNELEFYCLNANKKLPMADLALITVFCVRGFLGVGDYYFYCRFWF